MTTYYYHPLPQLPASLLAYFNQNGYPLSLKKKYIVSLITDLQADADIELLVYKASSYSNSISRSSIYLVLQWMVAHNLVLKTVYNDDSKIYYKVNTDKLGHINSGILVYAADEQALISY